MGDWCFRRRFLENDRDADVLTVIYLSGFHCFVLPFARRSTVIVDMICSGEGQKQLAVPIKHGTKLCVLRTENEICLFWPRHTILPMFGRYSLYRVYV